MQAAAPEAAAFTALIVKNFSTGRLRLDIASSDLELLIHLAQKNNARIQEKGPEIWPYKAITIIRRVK